MARAEKTLHRHARLPTRNKVTEKEVQLQVRPKQPRVGKVEKKERRIVDAANWRFMNIIGSGSIDLSLFPFRYPSERECFFYFGNHIETPYVSGLSQAPDVCNGNSWHRGKKNYEWRWRLKRGGGGRGAAIDHESVYRFFHRRHVDICNYRTEAATVSFYSRFERRFLISGNEAPPAPPLLIFVINF